MAAWPVRCRSGSNISAGPVAQLSPITSTSMASRAHRAAPISVPGNMVPVSSMVTWVWMGRMRPVARHGPPGPVDGRLGLQQVEDGLDDDEVDAALDEGRGLFLVGIAKVGVPDLPRVGNLVPGPMLPATHRGRSGVEKSSAAARASVAAARLSSRTRWAWPYSASTGAKAPKASVSTTSQPTSRNDRWTRSMTSGRVTTSSSLQPSSSGPPKSSAVSSASCRLVPMAPSKMTTRSETASR